MLRSPWDLAVGLNSPEFCCLGAPFTHDSLPLDLAVLGEGRRHDSPLLQRPGPRIGRNDCNFASISEPDQVDPDPLHATANALA